MSEKAFTTALMRWHRSQNRRQMPWKGEKDPYKIWISEIILQQTRVEQGLSYYNRFISRFPDLKSLAQAKDTEVYKLWEGLGYYSRCRNLIHTAGSLFHERKGVFPDNYEDILALKGIGPYTAAAISSFAFGEPRAVVDGNVIRVLSRYFALRQDPASSAGKKLFARLADSLLYKKDPGAYNQAIMDFGATVCKPAPVCEGCPLQKNCLAFGKGKVQSYPLKKKKAVIKERWFFYVLIQVKGKWVYRQRPAGDIWHNLHEFIFLEGTERSSLKSMVRKVMPYGKAFEISYISEPHTQKLSHQIIHARFLHIKSSLGSVPAGYQAAGSAALKKKAFPRIINDYIHSAALFK